MALLFAVGFGAIAGFLPLPAPGDDAQEIADTFRDHTNRIRLGLILAMIGAAFIAPFCAVITVQMKRIEGPSSPLAYTQLALGAIFVLAFIFPLMILQAAAYRPERAEETILAYSDLAWLMFVGVVSITMIQFLVIGVAILKDRREQPIFARWVGYLNLWAALLFCPGNVIYFFKSGPFAWNGLVSWWITVIGFFIWLVAMTVALLQAIARQETDRPLGDLDSEIVDAAVRQRFALLEAEIASLRADAVSRGNL